MHLHGIRQFLVTSCLRSMILVLVCLLPDYISHALSFPWHTLHEEDPIAHIVMLPNYQEDEAALREPLKILSALLRQRCAVSLVGSCASSTVGTVHATVFSGSRSWFEGGYMCISRFPRIRQSMFPGLTVDACSFVSPGALRTYQFHAGWIFVTIRRYQDQEVRGR